MASPAPEPHGTVAGVILAAGASDRMGRAKQLLPYRGRPLLQHVVDVAEASRLDRIFVVTGASGDRVEDGLHLERAEPVRNPDFRRGNMSSLECGAAAASDAGAFVILMGDHPGVRVDAVDQMVALWREHRSWGGVTAYRDRIAHPFLLSRSALDAAVAVGGPKLLWCFLAEDETGKVAHVVVDYPAPADINTPDDYDRLTTSTAEPNFEAP